MSNKRIIFNRPDGGVSIIIPSPDVPMARVMQDIPTDAIDPQVVNVEDIPQDRMFRAAWKVDGKKCMECPIKSKELAHDIRRAKRSAEFAPHDEAIAKQLPGKAGEAEAARVAIRDKYAALQTQIDAATTVAELKELVK